MVDALGRVTIGPLDGLGSAIVVTDVAFKLARQVRDRGEDPAGNDLALDFGEPIFYLVEPGGVSRSVVELDGGVSREELLNPLGLVRREIVGNEMNLLATRLIGDHLGEEGNKLLAGVTRSGFAHHLAAVRVLSAAYSVKECRDGSIQSRGARAARGDSGRALWVEPIQSLDGGLFVDAKHRCMMRRLYVQPNNIGGLGLKVRGRREASVVACDAMRL